MINLIHLTFYWVVKDLINEKSKVLLYTLENQLKLLFAYLQICFAKFVCVNIYFLVIFQSYHC